MKRYLQQLHSDIEFACRQAPLPVEISWFPNEGDDENRPSSSVKPVKLHRLFQIEPEAFPPEKFLSDQEINDLLTAIVLLWKSWNLYWEMPRNLPDRKKYTAMLHTMNGEPVNWQAGNGAEVIICRLDEGDYCPFDPDRESCYCHKMEEAAQQKSATWEERIRSIGIDPDEELDAVEEHEIMILELQRIYGDDWEKFADADLLYSILSDDSRGFYLQEENQDEDYLFDAFPEDYFDDEKDDNAPPSKEDDWER